MPVAGVAAPMPAVVAAAAACAFVVVVVAAARTCWDSRDIPRWLAPIERRPVAAAVAVAVDVAATQVGGPSCQRNRCGPPEPPLAGPKERGGR